MTVLIIACWSVGVVVCLFCISNVIKWLVRQHRANKNHDLDQAFFTGDMVFKWLIPVFISIAWMWIWVLVINIISKK